MICEVGHHMARSHITSYMVNTNECVHLDCHNSATKTKLIISVTDTTNIFIVIIITNKIFILCNDLKPFGNWNCYNRIDKNISSNSLQLT